MDSWKNSRGIVERIPEKFLNESQEDFLIILKEFPEKLHKDFQEYSREIFLDAFLKEYHKHLKEILR